MGYRGEEVGFVLDAAVKDGQRKILVGKEYSRSTYYLWMGQF